MENDVIIDARILSGQFATFRNWYSSTIADVSITNIKFALILLRFNINLFLIQYYS